MPHDQECANLALHFLGTDAPAGQVISLANRIQESVEDWLREREAEVEEMERERHEMERRAQEDREMDLHFTKYPHG